jgi:hypothetical protein
MRVAVFCALILMVATPSEASKSCMSVTEARQHFRLAHIYWHGPDHCWDASPGRRQRRVIDTVASKTDQRKWRDAMSAMVPDARVASEIAPDAQVAQILWLDRWADIKPSAQPLIAHPVDISHQATSSPSTAEPTTRSITVMLLFALLVIALPLAMIALPRDMFYRSQSE